MITSKTGFTENENITLSQELALLGVQATPFTSILLSKGVEKAINTVHVWKEETLDKTVLNGEIEGSETTVFQSTSMRQLSNTLQIFKKAVSISDTAGAMNSTKFTSEVSKRLLELKIELERTLINGTLADGSKGDFIRKLGGLINFADATNAVATTKLAEVDIKSAARKLWDADLSEGQIYALINADLKDQLDDLYKDRHSYVNEVTDFGLVVDTVNTNFGRVKFILSKHVPADKIVVFNDEYVRLATLRDAQFVQLAKSGDNSKGHIVMESTLKVGTPLAISVITVGK